MNEIATLVPGFDAALRGKTATVEAFTNLDRALGRATFSGRTRARIALAVAQQIGCDYCIWTMERLAQHAGLSGEDVVFARMGSAVSAREAAITRLACRLLMSSEPLAARPLPQQHFTVDEVTELRAHVAHAVLTCYVLQSLAPRTGEAAKKRREASK